MTMAGSFRLEQQMQQLVNEGHVLLVRAGLEVGEVDEQTAHVLVLEAEFVAALEVDVVAEIATGVVALPQLVLLA